MSLYTVTSIPLAPIAGTHNGTGFHQDSIWLVDPATVQGSNPLQFVGSAVENTAFLYELNTTLCPNWFGVAVPSGIQDFTRAHIFFHPLPGQAMYDDNDYKTKAGLWKHLFYYMDRLGYQLDAAERSQIIIMPFLKTSATDTGIFLANWFDIVTDILMDVRKQMGADDGSPLALTQVVVSSFSIGIEYSANFRAGAPALSTYLGEVWDFDAHYAKPPGPALSDAITGPSIKYDQRSGAGPTFHVPLSRWLAYAYAPTNSGQVHSLIRDFMFFHAAWMSSVGDKITPAPPLPAPAPTPSPTSTPTPTPSPHPAPSPSPAPFSSPTISPTPSTPIPQPSPAPAPSKQPGPSPVPLSPSLFPIPPSYPMPLPRAPWNPMSLPTPESIPVSPAPTSPILHPSPQSPIFPGPGSVLPGTIPESSKQPSAGQPTGPQVWRPVGPVHSMECCCCCCVAITAMIANTATTANTAVAAITAIASLNLRKR